MAPTDSEFQTSTVLEHLHATARLGAQIAAGLTPGCAVALTGDLGAGKTALARTILEALGVREAVPSPTFTIVQQYETARFPIRHYDLYRIEDSREMDELGLDEALDEGAVLMEWPEKAENILPEETLRVHLTITGESARTAKIIGSARWREYLSPLGDVHER